MTQPYETIADIIAETCDIARDEIQPESHLTDDLGVDSIDFLDAIFAIDRAFGIKIPFENWAAIVNGGKEPPERYFTVAGFSDRVAELIDAKAAA